MQTLPKRCNFYEKYKSLVVVWCHQTVFIFILKGIYAKMLQRQIITNRVPVACNTGALEDNYNTETRKYMFYIL